MSGLKILYVRAEASMITWASLSWGGHKMATKESTSTSRLQAGRKRKH